VLKNTKKYCDKKFNKSEVKRVLLKNLVLKYISVKNYPRPSILVLKMRSDNCVIQFSLLSYQLQFFLFQKDVFKLERNSVNDYHVWPKITPGRYR